MVAALLAASLPARAAAGLRSSEKTCSYTYYPPNGSLDGPTDRFYTETRYCGGLEGGSKQAASTFYTYECPEFGPPRVGNLVVSTSSCCV